VVKVTGQSLSSQEENAAEVAGMTMSDGLFMTSCCESKAISN